MEHTGYLTPEPLYAPDYSSFCGGCDNCGKIIAQVTETKPRPCHVCYTAHYCSITCLVAHLHTGHKVQCFAALDAEVDMRGAETPTAQQALWDLRRYTYRWHDKLAYAAIAAMNLHADPTAMNRQALVVHLSYVTQQAYRTRRFRLQSARVDPLESLVGTTMHGALLRRADNHQINQRNGMAGCALIMLACLVPGIGFIFNSTFVGPEPSLLADPPAADWLNRLWLALRRE